MNQSTQITDLLSTIKMHIDNKMLLRVERKSSIDDQCILGFPVSVSNDLLLMSQVVDLRDEGYVILRVSDIVDAYSLKSDAFYEKICSNEGLKSIAFEQNFLKNVSSLKIVLDQLQSYFGFVSIDCSSLDNELIFSIGKIVEVEDECVRFIHFDPSGLWEKNERCIPLNKITSITFGDNYSKMYFKYMKSV